MKHSYEITVVLRLDTDDTLKTQIDEIKGWMEGEEQALGTVTKIDTNFFGRRRLAYEIEGQREGYYVIFFADVEGGAIDDLERELRLASYVLRHLVIRLDE